MLGKKDCTNKTNIFHVVPFLNLVAIKGDPIGLGYKINPQAKVR